MKAKYVGITYGSVYALSDNVVGLHVITMSSWIRVVSYHIRDAGRGRGESITATPGI